MERGLEEALHLGGVQDVNGHIGLVLQEGGELEVVDTGGLHPYEEEGLFAMGFLLPEAFHHLPEPGEAVRVGMGLFAKDTDMDLLLADVDPDKTLVHSFNTPVGNATVGLSGRHCSQGTAS